MPDHWVCIPRRPLSVSETPKGLAPAVDESDMERVCITQSTSSAEPTAPHGGATKERGALEDAFEAFRARGVSFQVIRATGGVFQRVTMGT